MRIISISGLDGSGKSTQINLLKEFLESQGKKVLYFHSIQFSLANKISGYQKKFLKKGSLDASTGSEKSTGPGSSAGVTSANWTQIQLRKIFLLIDILRFRSTYLGTYQSTYDYVLSDRYFYDTIINIRYLSKGNPNGRLLKLAERLIPRPDKAFYLEAEPALIMQRRRIPDQGIEYLRKKRDLFDETFSKWEMEKIDGNGTEQEIFEEIKSLA